MKPVNSEANVKLAKHSSDVCGVKNILISDSATGFVICERIYDWKEGTNTTNLGLLLRSFYQFSREIDDGGIVSISFDEPRTSKVSKKGNAKRTSKSGAGLSNMKLITREAGPITISIFIDPRTIKNENTSTVAATIDAIEAAFQSEYMSIYETVHSRIVAVADALEDNAEEAAAIRNEFSNIHALIDDIAQKELSC